jgi:tetratricopeptide (TPR) repeat protein
MVLQYGFNFPEAIHAFYRASSLDEGAAMPYWGIALSASSNINSAATNGCNRLAYRAAEMALEHARRRQADPAAQARYTARQLQREVDYAEAYATMFRRVGPDRVMVDDDTQRAYAQAMEILAGTYFDDLDAATLYADALLNVTPWKWWYGNVATSDRVAPTPEAERALQVLNKVLIQDPLHVGANHFYIHAIEESPFADSAMPMAHRLPDRFPGAGHLVHMASHVYQRAGDNALASDTNYVAVAVDRAYVEQAPTADVYPLHYLGHNIHFLTWTLSIEGRQDASLAAAEELVQNTTRYSTDAYTCTRFPEEIAIKSDFFYTVPYYFAVRFQDWDYLDRMEVQVSQGLQAINQACGRAAAEIGQQWVPLTAPYSNAMLAYARAYRTLSQNTLDSQAAIAALSSYWSVVKATLEADTGLRYGTNQAVDLFRIANLILINKAQDSTRRGLDFGSLQASIRDQLARGPAKPLSDDVQEIGGSNAEQVIAVWQRAVAVQDGLNYDEPPNWYYTLRESLGYAYLAQGQYQNAERTFVEDLTNNRLSGRSLFGLEQSIRQQPGRTVPALLEQQFANAWRNATVSPAP